MSREILWYNHDKLEDVRKSHPQLWITKYLYAIKDNPDDLKYFTADICKNIIPDCKKTLYAEAYKPYPQTQAGVIDFWKNFAKVFSWHTVQPRKITTEIQKMTKCMGMNKDYELMDKAIIYLHYDNICTLQSTGKEMKFECCDKLILENNKIIEFHHNADMKADYTPVVPPMPDNDYNVIQEFENAFGSGNIADMIELLSNDFTFRIYKADDLALLANFTDPCIADRAGFEDWLRKFYSVVKVSEHKTKQQVNDPERKKSFVTVEGKTFPAWINGSRKPWVYYDVHNFDLDGPFNDESTRIKGLVWHIDFHPLVQTPP